MRTNNYLNKSNDGYSEIGVVSEYEDKGLAILEKKIYSKYLTKLNARILDIGCFVGRVSFSLAHEGYNIFGIDTSFIAVKRANELKTEKKVKNVHFEIASATNIPFDSNIFDYVLFPYNTIEAISSKKARMAAMKEASRTLKKDGLVLFSVLNRFYPKNYIRIVRNEAQKLLVKLLLAARADKLLPVLKQKYIQENIKTEYGSILWIEPGAENFITCHFSTTKEIKELLRISSFELIEKIPVMHHGPQRPDADILQAKYFSFIKAPVFYYVCRKKQ